MKVRGVRRFAGSRPSLRGHRTVGALFALSAVLLAAEAASAGARATVVTPAQATVKAVGADYVIAVDTSGSMQQAGLYKLVTPAIGAALRGADATDHLSLLTFDTVPAVRFDGPLGSQPERVTRHLPKAATGDRTDIGAAVDAMISRLERPGATEAAVAVLVTDGEPDPPAGSRYCTTPACDGAWRALAERARRLPPGRAQVYGIALRPRIVDPVRRALERVFERPEVVDLRPGEIAAYLDQVKQRVRLAQARELVRKDTAAAVEASWSSLSDLELGAGRAEGRLTLRSTARDLPLAVTGLTVAAEGFPVGVSGVPDSVKLAPGAEQAFPVVLTWDPVRRPDLLRPTATREGELRLSGRVAPDLGAGLDEANPRDGLPLRGTTAAVGGTAQTGWDRTTLIGLGVLLLIALASGVGVWLYRNPAMDGVLVVDRLVQRPPPQGGYGRKRLGIVQLSGRWAWLRDSDALTLGTLPGWVRGTRPPRGSLAAVRIAFRGPGTRWPPDRRICRLGQLVVVRGHVFRYLPRDSPALRETGATTSARS
jgi:Mg-chelatase subunit ChlD